jgi:NAD(P)H-nitrite reductase large subunit
MRHVIVGAGPAAQAAIETIRALDAAAEITLVCDEPPYARMALPYYVIGRVPEEALMTGGDAWFESLRVETRFGRRAARLAPDRDVLVLDDDSELPFDRLLVATGSRARVPPIPGADGPGCVCMWTLDDAKRFLAEDPGEVLIVGAGFIAFTVLDALAKRADRVSFVEIEPRILPHMLDPASAEIFRGFLSQRGIEAHVETRVEGIEPAGARRRVALSGGKALECDLVVLATGVAPNVELLEGSGVEIDAGVVVDGRMQTRRANVFAAGDVAAGPDLLGGPRRVQAIQPTAVDHGRIAGANMAGEDIQYAGSLTMNILAAQGIEAASFGFWERDDEVTVAAAPATSIYRKLVWDGDRLVGGILVGPTLAVSGVNDVGMLKGLVQTGTRLGLWKDYLAQNPMDLRRAFVASGAAKELLASNLLAGRASTGGGYRHGGLPPLRPRSSHHATLVTGL